MVRAKPGVGFLLLGRSLMIAQMRSAVDNDDTAGFVSCGLRQQAPEIGPAEILLGASPAQKQLAILAAAR